MFDLMHISSINKKSKEEVEKELEKGLILETN